MLWIEGPQSWLALASPSRTGCGRERGNKEEGGHIGFDKGYEDNELENKLKKKAQEEGREEWTPKVSTDFKTVLHKCFDTLGFTSVS